MTNQGIAAKTRLCLNIIESNLSARGLTVRGSERGEHWHPTQKSVEVMAWCIEQLGLPPGALILDPFMGSGTTGLACLKTGRAFVGLEIDSRWYSAAMKRLDVYLAQAQLF